MRKDSNKIIYSMSETIKSDSEIIDIIEVKMKYFKSYSSIKNKKQLE